jgi:hypothetical protein
MSPLAPVAHPHKAPPEVRELFDEIEGREERIELNLYVTGYEDAPENEPEDAHEDPPEDAPEDAPESSAENDAGATGSDAEEEA